MKRTGPHRQRAGRQSVIGRWVGGWLQAHGRACVGALGRLSRTRTASIMTTAVLGIALALPTAFLLLLQNVEGVTSQWDGGATVSLFMESGVPEADYRALADDVAGRDGIRTVDVISPEQALTEFRNRAGMEDALALLDENPLPPSLVVVPTPELDAAAVEALSTELAALDGVETVRLDLEWVRRLQAFMELLRRAVWLVAGLLAITVVLVVGNTIRLAIENRREEIVITKLIGGTNAFIRRPFLYEGVWYGAFGGLLAVVLVESVRMALSGPAGELARLYQTGLSLQGLGGSGMVTVLLSGVLLGLAGSWLAVGRHLAAIEPG